jgi:hypothetical protein
MELNIPHDLVYAKTKAPLRPTAPVNRIMGAKPPLPTNEGDVLSQRSSNPGLRDPTAAPYAQSEGRVYRITRLKCLHAL